MSGDPMMVVCLKNGNVSLPGRTAKCSKCGCDVAVAKPTDQILQHRPADSFVLVCLECMGRMPTLEEMVDSLMLMLQAQLKQKDLN